METFPSSYASGSADEARAKLKDQMVARMMFRRDHAFDVQIDLKDIPHYRQTQRVLDDQLRDLFTIANRLGLYDAADYLGYKLGLRS